MAHDGGDSSGIFAIYYGSPLLQWRILRTMHNFGFGYLPLVNVLPIERAERSYPVACSWKTISNERVSLFFSTIGEDTQPLVFLNLLEHLLFLNSLTTKYSFIDLFAIEYLKWFDFFLPMRLFRTTETSLFLLAR